MTETVPIKKNYSTEDKRFKEANAALLKEAYREQLKIKHKKAYWKKKDNAARLMKKEIPLAERQEWFNRKKFIKSL